MPDWERQVAENAQRYQELTARLGELSITESSGDGAVKVTISAAGLLTDLVLRERWHPEPLADVAAEIMACLRRAQARIPDLLRDTMFEVVGPNDPEHPSAARGRPAAVPGAAGTAAAPAAPDPRAGPRHQGRLGRACRDGGRLIMNTAPPANLRVAR